jgi:hypothetical protein
MPEQSDTEMYETEERVVQESEIHDTLAGVETAIRDLDEPFVRITVAPVTAEKHQANQALYDLVTEADECQNCGEPIDEGAWCGYSCLMEWGGAGD